MRNTYSMNYLIKGLTFVILLSFCQATVFASNRFPDLGINSNLRIAPRDSSFSIKLHSTPKLQNAQTTLTLNMGSYKELRYIKMYDLIGKKVFFQSLSYKPGISTYQIKMASLRPGIYVCSVYSDFGLVETRKLVHF
jgi:hypothetical protein